MHKRTLSTAIFTQSIDEARGILFGVSVVTKGEALGHGAFIDDVTLQNVMDAVAAKGGSIKAKMEHYTDAKDVVGVLRNFRLEGDQVRADLHLLQNSQFYSQIMEMAKEMPDLFGLSMTFMAEGEEIGGQVYYRVTELFSVDIVDDPAANPNGFFSAAVDNNTTHNMATDAEKQTTNMENTVENKEVMAETSAVETASLAEVVEKVEVAAKPEFDAVAALATLSAAVIKLTETVTALSQEVVTVKEASEGINKRFIAIEASRGVSEPVSVKNDANKDPKSAAIDRINKSLAALKR